MKSSRLFTRAALAGALSVSLMAVTVPQASAANRWSTQLTHSGGKLLLCKESSGRTWTIKMKLDNRSGKHWHKAWAWQTGTHKEVTTTAARGKASVVRKIYRVPRGSRVGVQLGHTWGGELGHYGRPTTKIRRC